ncbi:MAG TPA: sugar ABC transporter ATP-binding protein [Anaerolineae bacterium]|nr:sugar ABC transporter ATP-binding protein [Anaerolineae bacterium]HQI87147.1 sugar ABC transporter ATP-binding protein [Anaerolineae bacterium]
MSETKDDILIMQGISKAFPGVQALDDVDFSLQKGEIHCLVGENGAGKSTLIKVLTGVDRPDTGQILLGGKEIHPRSPQHSQTLGISTVYQEVNLCTNLSVAENILIGREPRKFGRIDWPAMNAQAANLLKRLLDVDIDVTQPLNTYTVAIQQMVAIARALDIASTQILILDEPTSSLDANETQQLFKVMRKLRDEGVGIIFITHFLSQVYEISDRITVLRNGKLVGTFETASLPRVELIAKMIGRSLDELDDMSSIKLESSKHIKTEAILDAQKVGRSGSIRPFDLQLRAGEVVGLAGLLGSGRTETARVLFGVDKPDTGQITFNGALVTDHGPLGSIKRGIALCPEDRKAEGIVDDLTVRENIVLAIQANKGWFSHIGVQEQYEIADKYIKMLNIATPTADQPVKNLSGGNQQKVILARWLATNPQVLILDEPTRGIDVGTKAEIQKLVLELADEGMACLFISSELEEVLRTSHRIAVLREREKVAEFSGEVDEHTIMHTIAGSEL